MCIERGLIPLLEPQGFTDADIAGVCWSALRGTKIGAAVGPHFSIGALALRLAAQVRGRWYAGRCGRVSWKLLTLIRKEDLPSSTSEAFSAATKW